MIAWWTGLWDRRERADSLALVRVLLALLILVDLLQAARLGLVIPLYAPLQAGGLGDPLDRQAIPELFSWFPATATTATVAFWIAVVAAFSLMLGLASRLSALVLLLVLAQLALVVPASDRGIDMLLRNALLVLVFSRAGAAWSVDARLRSGRWAGDGRPVPSWPRYLLVVQVVVLYFMAGVQKVSSTWLPPDWSALWIAMHDPHFARGEWPWMEAAWPLTRLATAATWAWEWSAPLILLCYWFRDDWFRDDRCRDDAVRPGRLRAWFNRHHVLAWWLLIGALFHLGTHLSLRLGIFPFAVLSLYPAFVHPDAWGALRRRFGRSAPLAAAPTGMIPREPPDPGGERP